MTNMDICVRIDFVSLVKKPKKRSNLVRLNHKEIGVPDNEMFLLLHLLIELRKGEGGWVTSKLLCDEGITDQDIPQRSIGRLRNRLALGLLDGNSDKFVENDGAGSYRISTHPDFVTFPDKNWALKKYNEQKESVRKEREKREDHKKKAEEAAINKALSKQK